MDKSLDELKIDFVMSAYEATMKQIQQTDIKVSLLISWDSVIAVMLGRTLGQLAQQRFINVITIPMAALCLIFLGLSGIFIFWTLKPRAKFAKRDGFTGLLFNLDVLRLGKNSTARIEAYMREMAKIERTDQIYEQFVTSIALISDIAHKKNRSFMRGLALTAISFGWLVAVIGIVAVREGWLKR